VSELYLLTSAKEPPGEILPALGLLLHTLRTGPVEVSALADVAGADAVLVDARRDLVQARELCRLLRRVEADVPVLAVMTEGGLAAVTAEWGIDDVLLHTAGPAEVEARLRLAVSRQASTAPPAPDEIRSGDLSIDEATYTARLRSRVLDLTFKEFELLKFLAQHPGRVFTRAHLLQEVWGYDYFGGTRTVDVHVRRLRAKLGPEHEALIGTVRNVGYRFVPLKGGDDARRGHRREQPGTGDTGPDAADLDGTGSDGSGSDGSGSDGSGSDGTGSDGSGSDGTESHGTESHGTESDGNQSDGAGSESTGSEGGAAWGEPAERGAGEAGSDRVARGGRPEPGGRTAAPESAPRAAARAGAAHDTLAAR
jgi:DNA-binding response OmpR family regulator